MTLEKLNNPILSILALAMFIALAVHSQKPCVKYPLADACVNGVYTPAPEMSEENAAKMVYLWGMK